MKQNNKDANEGNPKNTSKLGCVSAILFVAVFLFFLSWLGDQMGNKVYLVKETEYFHSTNNPDKCRFIKIAKDRGYTIKMVENSHLYASGYKMCHECFPLEERSKYEDNATKFRTAMERLDSIPLDEEDEDIIEYEEDYLDDGRDEVTDRFENRTP